MQGFVAGQLGNSTLAFYVDLAQNSTANVLGRLSSLSGSGQPTGQAGEGNWLQQGDITSIAYSVFDLDSLTPTVPVASGSVNVSTCVLNNPVTTNTTWTEDMVGYNFIHSIPSTVFVNKDHRYLLQYLVTLANGQVFYGKFTGIVDSVGT